MAEWYEKAGRMIGNLWDDITGVTEAEAAATSQRDAADKAQSSLERMFSQSLDTQRPWLESGTMGLSQLGAGINSGAFETAPGQFSFRGQTDPTYSGSGPFQDLKFDFEADPGYQFRLSEGSKAVQSSAAARGGLFSGATGTALQDYAQGLASQEYGAAYGRFADQRNYRRGNYENDRAFGRGNFENDRNFSYGQFSDAFNRDRAVKTDRYNRLASLAGIGQVTSGNIGAQQMEQGGNLANLELLRGNIGAERAMAGYQGGMNVLNAGLQGLGIVAKAYAGG